MKILVLTSLFPNIFEPQRGIFSKNTVDGLKKFSDLKVVAPIPWFPRLRILRRIYQNNYKRHFGVLFDPGQIRSVDNPNYTIHYPTFFSIPKIGFALLGLFYFFAVRRFLSHEKYDAILGLWLYPDCFAGALASRIYGIPLISVGFGSDLNILSKNVLLKPMIRFALRSSKRIIVVSEALKKEILNIDPSLEERTEIIPNGTDLNIFKPMDRDECRKRLEIPLGKKVILYVGNLIRIKGADILVEAFSNYCRSSNEGNVDLFLVGDGNLRSELERKIQDMGIQSRVRFLGRQPHGMIPLWMNAADVICLPSLFEGCPNVLVEANACGKPIVATNVGGIPELVSNNSGILVPPGDSRELAEGLRKALTMDWKNYERANRSWDIVASGYFRQIKMSL
jgi:teichuronic acid biosynthesis glycosyltransferase TuaC